jgi:Fe-S-cluster-containing dehydrogenase component
LSKIDVEEQKVLLYDPSRCTGCLFCEIACSYYHFRLFDLNKAHLRVQFDEKNGEFEAVYCQHCDEPLCVAACPKEALVKDEKTGWVKVNPMKCIGCQTCTVACPLSAPWFNREFHVAMKCDFCNGDPQCAKFCSPQAIKVATRREAWEFNAKHYLEVNM